MAFPQQHEVHFSRHLSHAADPPQNAIAFPPFEHSQSAPTARPGPLRGLPHDHHASVPQPGNLIFQSVNATDNRLPIEDRENIPAVEILAAQAQPQDLWYVDMGDMANGYPPPHGHGNHIVGDNARTAQARDVPAPVQVAPPAPEMVIDIRNDQVQHATASPAPAFIGEDPYRDHDRIPNGRATEVLRQLALVYLSDPSSQLSMIHMEPTYDDGVTVVITLKLTDL